MQKIVRLIQENRLVLIGVIAGAVAGYLYYKNIGCESGTCAITSSPVNSTLYGMVMGGLILSMFKKEKKGEAGDEQNS